MEVVDEFVNSLEASGEYSSNTIQAYTSDLRRFFAYLDKKMGRASTLLDVTSRQMKGFLDTEVQNGFSASTLHRRKISLTQFAYYLRSKGKFTEAQLDEVLQWKQELWEEIYQRDVLVLPENDIKQLISTLEEAQTIKSVRDLSIIRLILETGLSVSETISINLSDLDLSSQNLGIQDGESSKRYSIKNTTSALKAYLEKGRPELTQSVNEEALFISQMGGRISRQGIWQLVREWGEKAGIGVSLSPRIIRNTAVQRMVSSGFSIAEMQKRLGHSNRYSTRALVRKIKRNLEEAGLEA